MVKLTGSFSQFRPFNVLLAGDLMLDTYTTGSVSRISPEAPVSVLHVKKEEYRAGGVGNVALNLKALGASVTLLGRVAEDAAGKNLIDVLEGIDTKYLVTQNPYQTPVKNRLIAERQQIVRVDWEEIKPLAKELEARLIDQLDEILQGIDVIAISDYNKGFLTKKLLSALIKKAKSKKIPVLADPKGHDFTKYRGVTLIKPNLKEAYLAAGVDQTFSLEEVAGAIFNQSHAQYLLVTRSDKGISLFTRELVRKDFPVKSREVTDVTGAGDTVLAVLCASIAGRLDLDHAAEFANIAAGLVIEKLGCASITLSDLARRLLEIDSDNKIFDEHHLYVLKEVLKNTPYTILPVNSQKGLTKELFLEIEKSSSKKDHELIAYIEDDKPSPHFIHMLSAIEKIDFVVLSHENLNHVLAEIS